MTLELFIKSTSKIALCVAFGVGAGIMLGFGAGLMAGAGAMIVVVSVQSLSDAIATNKQQGV